MDPKSSNHVSSSTVPPIIIRNRKPLVLVCKVGTQTEVSFDNQIYSPQPLLNYSPPSHSDFHGPVRPYYPVQGPFLPHSLYGPEVPLHPVWSNTALLVRQSIFRYLRITSAGQMRALNDEFMSDLAHIRNQRFLRRILANSENTTVLPSTLRLFRSLRDLCS